MAAILVNGCSHKFSNLEKPGGGELRWGVPAEITTLDPATSSDARVLDYLRQVFEGLVSLDPSGKVIPCLATRWDIDSTGRIFTFYLAKGIRFSDGHSFSARDVKFSFDRAAQKSFSGSLVPFYLGDIQGIDASISGGASGVSGVQILDDQTIRITLNRSKQAFLSKLAYPVSAIVCAQSVPRDHPIERTEDMVGTGPYVPVKFTQVGGLELLRNPYFHGSHPSFNKISIIVVKDPATRLNMFRMGKLDLTLIQNSDVAVAQSTRGLASSLHLTSKADLTYLQFNSMTCSVLSDRRVRRALAIAIDRDWLAKQVLGGVPLVATGLVPSGVPGILSLNPALPFRPDQAKALLSEAGYPGGKGFPPIDIAYLDQQRDHPAVEAIVIMWRHTLGISVSTRPYAASALLDKNAHHQLACFYTGWTGDYPDPEDYLTSLFSSTSPANGSGFANKTIDAQLSSADSDPKTLSRGSRYGQIEKNLIEECPIVPLFFVREAELVNPRLSDLTFSPFGHLQFTAQAAVQPRKETTH